MNEPVPQEAPQQRSPGRSGRGWLLLLVGLVLGVAGDRLFLVPNNGTKGGPRNDAGRGIPAGFSRVGDRIIVPATSSLRTRLALEEPTMKEVSHTLVLPGLVEADPGRTVKVMPPVTGRVIDLMAQLGGRVVMGENLALIDSGDLAQAISDEEKARSALKLARQTLDRLMVLERTSAIAVKEREQAQSDFAQAQSELERADARLRAIGAPLDQKTNTRLLQVKVPVSGSVIDLQVAPGAFVNDPTAPMMTIANLDTVWVTANVPEKDTSFVSKDRPVSVTFPAYPGKVYEGKVLFVSDVLEPDTRRTKVRIAFDNPDRSLKPGMFANVSFSAPMISRLVVPTSALLMSNDRTSVFAEVEPWTFVRRDVVTEYEEGNAAVILSGLNPGERIIVKGAVVFND
jgi:cobalt-zinc-cadmium efflux system membrane fusion protein